MIDNLIGAVKISIQLFFRHPFQKLELFCHSHPVADIGQQQPVIRQE